MALYVQLRDADGASQEEVANAIVNRLVHNEYLLKKALSASSNGMEGVMWAIDTIAELHAGIEELGSSDISNMVREVLHELGVKEDPSEKTISEEELFQKVLQALSGTSVGYKQIDSEYDEKGTVTIHFWGLEE